MAIDHPHTISFQSGSLPIVMTEVWSNPGLVSTGDIVRYWYADAQVDGAPCITDFTIEIDLTRPVAALLADMKRKTRSQIHHASREGFGVHLWRYPDDSTLESFREFYNRVTRLKKLSATSIARLNALQKMGLLAVSNATSPSSGEPLVWHCYECVGNRVRCWYSASNFRSAPTSRKRNEAGRANRYLHFKDLEAFKSAGFAIYDFGGWYPGKEDYTLLCVNRFKETFGGKLVQHSHCDVGVTPPGKCWLKLRQIRHNLVRHLSLGD